MQNWRDTTPITTQAEIDSLVRVALGVAQERLATHGLLRQAIVAADLDGSFETETEAVLPPSETLTGRLLRDPHMFRSVAMVSTGRADDSDVVNIRVEHRDGVAMDVTARFEVIGLCGGVAFGQISSTPVEPEVWAEMYAVA